MQHIFFKMYYNDSSSSSSYCYFDICSLEELYKFWKGVWCSLYSKSLVASPGLLVVRQGNGVGPQMSMVIYVTVNDLSTIVRVQGEYNANHALWEDPQTPGFNALPCLLCIRKAKNIISFFNFQQIIYRDLIVIINTIYYSMILFNSFKI